MSKPTVYATSLIRLPTELVYSADIMIYYKKDEVVSRYSLPLKIGDVDVLNAPNQEFRKALEIEIERIQEQIDKIIARHESTDMGEWVPLPDQIATDYNVLPLKDQQWYSDLLRG